VDGAQGEWETGESEELGDKAIQTPVCPSQTPHELACDLKISPRWEAGDEVPGGSSRPRNVSYMGYVFVFRCPVGRDSSVGIATHYGLDGPGIESRWGARFSAPVQKGPGTHPASYAMGTGSFPGAKRQGRGVRHPPLSSAEAKERVELYPLLHPWAFVACYRMNFTFLPLPLPSGASLKQWFLNNN
jgi:hypothetical protein